MIKDKQKPKQIQKLSNEKIAKAKRGHKEKDKMLSCMSSNIRKAWQGIKCISGLANKQTTNYYLMQKHEQTTFANSLNSFYTRFNSYTTPNADSEKAADGNYVDGDVAIGEAAEADGDDGTTPAGSDSELLDITIDEVRKQFVKMTRHWVQLIFPIETLHVPKTGNVNLSKIHSHPGVPALHRNVWLRRKF